MNLSNNKILYGLLMVIFISTCLLFTSMTSPLFPTHNWVDPNCFFTVGKGIVLGYIPYVDLFEQKGPLIYFLHALGYLISPNNFYGIYLIQIVLWTINFYIIKRIYSLFIDKKLLTVISSITVILFLCVDSFARGDNAEEFSLTPLLWSLLILSEYYFKQDNILLSYKKIMILGLCCGSVILIKFTLVGFWIAALSFLFFTLIKQKQYKRAIYSCLLFGIFCYLPFIPIIIYFNYHDALFEFFNSYFIVNIFMYSKDLSLLTRIYKLLEGVFLNIVRNLIIVIFSILGLWSFKKKYNNKRFANFIIYSYLVSYLGLFIGGTFYIYYYYILVPFSIFGIIFLVNKYSNILINIMNQKLKYGITTMVLYLLLFSNCFPFYLAYFGEVPQLEFASYINKVEGATMLNYGFLDGGFYLAADKMPINKYFCKLNIDKERYPIMYDTQDDMIQNKEVDFVITRVDMKTGLSKVECPYLADNYELVSVSYNKFDAYEYSLYQVKE